MDAHISSSILTVHALVAWEAIVELVKNPALAQDREITRMAALASEHCLALGASLV